MYDGEWKEGNQHGKGTLTYNRKIYIGAFVNGKRTGRGKLTVENGVVLEGKFLDGTPIGWHKVTSNGKVEDVFYDNTGARIESPSMWEQATALVT